MMTEEQFVDRYMKDWKNVMDDKGKLVAFNREEAIAMLKRNPDIYKSLQEVCNLV